MILTPEELLGFVHLPSLDVPKLAREIAKTKVAPRDLQIDRGFSLGFNSHAGRVAEIRLTPGQRVRHCHTIGASGTGKSTLLFNSIRQDIEAGEGVAVLDPHADLIDCILGIIPEERIADVVLLGPSEETAFIGFIILSAHSDLEKSLLASDLVPVFPRLLTTVEPLVTEDLWQKCNDMLEARITRLARPAKRAVHLFAGLTTCECGKKMCVPTNSPNYVCTACRNKIPIVDLEGIFLDELRDYLVAPDRVAAYLREATHAVSEKAQLLESLQAELQRVKQQADQTNRLYIEGGVTVQQFKEVYQPLDARKSQIEAEFPRLEAELALLRIDGLSSDYIMAEARDLHSRWPKMTQG